MHWLLSNSIYVFIFQGSKYFFFYISCHSVEAYSIVDYFNDKTFYLSTKDSSLPGNTIVGMGYSTRTILLLFVACCIMASVPLAVSFKKLPGKITNVGSNSMAISAACHVSPEAKVTTDKARTASPPMSSRVSLASRFEVTPPTYSPLRNVNTRHSEDGGGYYNIGDSTWDENHQTSQTASGGGIADSDGIELQQLIADRSMVSVRTDYSREPLTTQDLFEKISQSKIRWGVVEMPAEFYKRYDCSEGYEHLGFGIEGEEISSPQNEKLYA